MAVAHEKVSSSLRAEYDADIAFFKAGLREYFFSLAAGHYRLEATDCGVKMHFFPGDATIPGRIFDLTPGPPKIKATTFIVE